MTLPTGQISMSQVANELGVSSSNLSLGSSSVRALAGIPSGQISMSDLRGKSRATIRVVSNKLGFVTTSRTNSSSTSASLVRYTSRSPSSVSLRLLKLNDDNWVVSASNRPSYGYWSATGVFRITAHPTGGGISASVNVTVSASGQTNPPYEPTCFAEGSMVLMGDGSVKEITTIEKGDIVQGPTMAWEVDHLHIAKLGPRKMMSFSDRSLTWSDEHLFWARRDDKQWWWCANPDNWRLEVEMGFVTGLFDNYSHFVGDDVEFAHVDDIWRRREVIDVTESDNCSPTETKVYLPMPGDVSDRMCFVNGYLVTASTNQWEMDYTKFDWRGLNK